MVPGRPGTLRWFSAREPVPKPKLEKSGTEIQSLAWMAKFFLALIAAALALLVAAFVIAAFRL